MAHFGDMLLTGSVLSVGHSAAARAAAIGELHKCARVLLPADGAADGAGGQRMAAEFVETVLERAGVNPLRVARMKTCTTCHTETPLAVQEEHVVSVSVVQAPTASAPSLISAALSPTDADQTFIVCEACAATTRHTVHNRWLVSEAHPLPDVLAVELQRVAADGTKARGHTPFHRTLDTAGFMADGAPGATYTLTGVIVHAGVNAEGGHYVAFTRRLTRSSTWARMQHRNSH
jgi:hypothetical protein